MSPSEPNRAYSAGIAGSSVALATGGLLAVGGLGGGWTGPERAVALLVGALVAGVLGAALGAALARLGHMGVTVTSAVLVAVLGMPTLQGGRAPDGRGRTVVLVTIDTLRRDHVGAYPDAAAAGLTPALDAFADRAIRFDEAVTPSPLTLPSHTAMLTGRAPWETGVVQNGRPLPELATVAQALAADGYTAAAFTSTALLAPELGLVPGFEPYRAPSGPLAAVEAIGYARPVLSAARAAGWADASAKVDGAIAVERALDWVAAQRPDASIFLWVHLYDPHQPYGVRPAVEPADLPDPCSWAGHVSGLRRGGARPMHPARLPIPVGERCTDGDWAFTSALLAGYASEVRHADRNLQTLIDGLRSRGRWEDAGVVIAADHGESLVEHQAYGSHQFWLTDPVVRVPLFVRDPGCADCDGTVRRDRVDLTQVASTLAELGGVPFDGAPSLLEPSRSRVATVGPAPVASLDSVGPTLHASVRIGGGKVILDEVGHLERYLVDRDPEERVLYLTPDEERTLRNRIEATKRAWSEGRPSPGAVAVGPPRALSPEVLGALDAIEVRVLDEVEVVRFADADRRVRAILSEARAAVDARGEIAIEGETQLRLLGYVDDP